MRKIASSVTLFTEKNQIFECIVKRILLITGMSLLLVACSKPRDLGQQYEDGVFNQVLNPVGSVNSDKSKSYSQFPEQLKKVLSHSPSLVSQHQAVYIKVGNWLKSGGDPKTLTQFGLNIEQMGGGDGHGNVLFTGYFSPVITLSRTPKGDYKYPVYRMPECGGSAGACPSREAIYNGALAGAGLELGYSNSLIDVFIMEVQGSGFVKFKGTDGLEYFAYGGKNGHAYVSIGRLLIEQGEVEKEKMSLKAIIEWASQQNEARVKALLVQNPSYVFFSPQITNDVKGTAGIPLIAGASVAADRKYLPMGSVLLAEVPQLNEQGEWNGLHVLKLLMALDTGGAVKGNHLDLYHGKGDDAGIKAGLHKHFGRVWRLTSG